MALILMIKERVRAINDHLSGLAENFAERKNKLRKNEFFKETVEFLKSEMGGPRTGFNESGKSKLFLEKIENVTKVGEIKFVKPFEGKKGEEKNFSFAEISF